MQKKYEIDMCTDRILPKMLLFAFPLMLSSVLQLLFNAADVIVVGKFAGETALAAVGSTGSLINLIVGLFTGLSVGANVVAARFFASKSHESLSKTVHTAISISLLGGVVLTAFGLLFADDLLRLMKTPSEVLPLAILYIRIYFCGMLPSLFYNFGSALLRAKGDTRRPFIYISIAGVINVILNLDFVIAFEMGVAGVAIATVISQLVSAVLILRCLVKESGDFKFEIKKLCLDSKIVAKIFGIGFPSGLQGIIYSLSNVVLQSSVNSFGADVVAANAAADNIQTFIWVAMNAFAQAAVTFESQNIGGGKFSRIGKVAGVSCLCGATTGFLMGGFCVLFPSHLISLYATKEEVITAGVLKLCTVAGIYFLCGIQDCLSGTIRGIGYSLVPTIISVFGACGVRVLWVSTAFQTPLFHSINGLYLVYPISWIIMIVAYLICFSILRKRLPKNDLPISANE